MTRTLPYGQPGGAYAQYYRHSGTITFVGPVLGLLAGVAAAVVLAFAYAYADLYVPLIYLNLLLCLGFGLALAAVPGYVMRVGKVRNTPIALAVTAVVVLVGYYTCWVVWECGVLDRYGGEGKRDFSYIELAEHPLGVVRLAELIDENGTWSLGHGTSSSGGGENISGAALGIIWAGEGLLILGTGLVVGRRFAGELPFCEQCDRWAEKPTVLARTAPGDPALLRRTLETGDYTYLASRVAGDAGAGYWRVEHNRCAGCDTLHTITVTDVRYKVDGKGRQTEKKKVILDRLLVSPEQLQSLRAALAGPPVPSVPPTDAQEVNDDLD